MGIRIGNGMQKHAEDIRASRRDGREFRPGSTNAMPARTKFSRKNGCVEYVRHGTHGKEGNTGDTSIWSRETGALGGAAGGTEHGERRNTPSMHGSSTTDTEGRCLCTSDHSMERKESETQGIIGQRLQAQRARGSEGKTRKEGAKEGAGGLLRKKGKGQKDRKVYK
jgi:hypothetical protein